MGLDVGDRAPETDGETGKVGGAEGGGFEHRGSNNGNAEEVGLELQHEVVGGGSAVDPELGDRIAGFRLHGVKDVADLEGDAFEGGAGDVARCGSAMDADDEAAGVGVPVGRAEAGKGGNEDDATGVRDRCGEGFDVAGVPDEAEVVAEPLDDGATDEDGAFERVFQLLAGAGGQRGNEAVLGLEELSADVFEQEAAGAVGVFGIARIDAELTEERGLLIARDAGDGGGTEAERGGDFADALRRPDDLGHHADGDVEALEEFGVPVALADIEEHGAGGVGVVSDVMLAAGEIPDEPTVDGAEGEFALLGAFACAVDVVEDPGDLGGGEVGIEQEAGAAAHGVFQSSLGKLAAVVGGTAVLPDDGVVDGLASCAVPDDGGFALVGDADGGEVAGARAGSGKDFDGGAHLRGEDVHGVVLDPSGAGIDLAEFVLRDASDAAVVVEENGAGAGGALVERENVIHENFPCGASRH